jgi:hypothetical protein
MASARFTVLVSGMVVVTHPACRSREQMWVHGQHGFTRSACPAWGGDRINYRLTSMIDTGANDRIHDQVDACCLDDRDRAAQPGE